MAKSKSDDRIDIARAAQLLDELWAFVSSQAEQHSETSFVDDAELRAAIHASINHSQVSYRFCLPIQLLGKLTNPALDCLSLQRGNFSRRGILAVLPKRAVVLLQSI